MATPDKPAWQTLKNNVAHGYWWRDAGLRKTNFILAVYVLVQVAGGFDKSLMNNLQSIPAWENMVDYPSSSALGLITASMSLGTIATSPFFSWMSDRYGRRPTMALGSCLMVIGAVLQAAATGRDLYISGRVVIGAGVTGTLAAGPVLVAEISHPRQRAVYTAFYNTLWYVGSTLAAWIVFGTSYIVNSSSWRVPCALQGVPALITLLSIWWLPESPRWLTKNGREDEAHRLIAGFHANGKLDDELVMFEMAEIKEALALEASFPKLGFFGGLSEFVATKANRYRLFVMVWFVLGIDWCGTAATSYYTSKIYTSVGVTDPHKQTAINGGLQIWQIITAMSGAAMAERLGRRKLWLLSFIGMICVNVPFGACSYAFAEHGNQAAGTAVIALVFMYQGTYNLGCNPLPYLYTTEIWPLRMRARGMGLEIGLDAMMGVLGQYTVPISLDSIAWKTYFVYTALLVVWTVGIYFTFPETKGLTLEEISHVFGDGSDQVQQLRIDATMPEDGKLRAESDSDVAKV